ncbi:metallophosphoesterase [Pseudopedobacter beijingensis]|uniref:Metallophosphoesterase n=1 Tax=Pseudopedobacter beijingensis TaxID=1207056 RepID=A0ABW4I9S8_9SPHI
MGKTVSVILLALLLLTFDYYIYKAILNGFKNWSTKRRKAFTAIWWSYSLLLFLGITLSVFFNIYSWLRTTIMVAFFITFSSKFFFLPLLLIDDLRRFIKKLRKKDLQPEEAKEENTIPRSEFLVKAGVALAAIPFGTLTWGIAKGAYDYRVRKQVLILPNLPSSFDGIKIAQISDVHSGSFYNKRAVLGGVEMLLNEKPDIAFFTGDLVNSKASEMRDYQDIFAKVKAPLGVFSILGNHDYGTYAKWNSEADRLKNLDDLKVTHKNMGWQLLNNTNKRIKVNNEEIGILGVENWGGGRFPKFGKMSEAVQNTEDLPIKLLLSHDPSHWRLQILKEYPDIDVMFSGHTHGAQFGIESEHFKWSPIQYVYDEWDGLYQEGHQQLFVNVGYGFLGYPGRVGILPEITIFELKKG